jgi:hypothetical protein
MGASHRGDDRRFDVRAPERRGAADALAADNGRIVALTVVLLPIIVNGTFYLASRARQTIAR